MKKICIINYKINNISSIKKAISSIGFDFDEVENGRELDKYTHIILPGIGSFDTGISQLKKLDLYSKLINLSNKSFIFGICLGMQLFFEKSEESKENATGLGIIKGNLKKLKLILKKEFMCLIWDGIK